MEPSENADDPRHDILVRYRRFEITREQADAEAQALGFESLEFRPDPREFDPLTLPFWTLPMTLAWIIYRAPEPVRELIEAYRAASLVWRHTGQFSINSGEPEKVFELLPPEPKSAFDVAYEARYRDVQEDLIYPGAAARNQLWEQLESGILVAEGIAPDQTAHNSIRDVEWKTLAFQPEAGIPVDAVSGWGEK